VVIGDLQPFRDKGFSALRFQGYPGFKVSQFQLSSFLRGIGSGRNLETLKLQAAAGNQNISSQGAGEPMHYLLFYEVGEDYVARRGEFRAAHLEKAWQASERGELVLGGALASPLDGAVLLFKGDSAEVAEKFARADPYVTSGAVKRWYVREWTTVAGEDAAKPIRPEGTKAASSAGHGTSAAPAKGMILRIWKGQARANKAGEYVQYATKNVFPELRAIEGHRGAYLLRRAMNGAVEFVVLTLWDSMAAIRKFAGAETERAVVAPEAQAMLSSFDDFVSHYEVVEGKFQCF
jgi:uncharacterized protein YciI/heme-degrading monooxygenase HmoA